MQQQPTQDSEDLEKTAGTVYRDDGINGADGSSGARRSQSFKITTSKDVISKDPPAISFEAANDVPRFDLAISTTKQMIVEEESGKSECPSAQDINSDVLGAKDQHSSKPDNTYVDSEMHDLETPQDGDELQKLLDSSFPEFDENESMLKGNDPLCMPMVCEVNYPYVPMSVEEVSVVTSLECWTNNKVRIVGKFLVSDISKYIFCGVDKDQGEIRLNLVNLDQYPKHGEILEVFGELENLQEKGATVIILKVMFCNRVQDFHLYSQALSMVKPFIPSFIKRHQ